MKLSLRQLRRNLLRDTVEHYNLSNRSSDQSFGCKYQHPDKEDVSCAIGRLIPKHLRLKLDGYGNGSVDNAVVFNQLPEGIKALGMMFLKSIQILHDSAPNWNDEGISASGLCEAKRIKITFKL